MKQIIRHFRLLWWRRFNPDRWMLAMIGKMWVAGEIGTDTAHRLLRGL